MTWQPLCAFIFQPRPPYPATAKVNPVIALMGSCAADANLMLGRIVPDFFPKIFGKSENEPLDEEGTRVAFTEMTERINDHCRATGLPEKTVDEVAFGFIKVSEETVDEVAFGFIQVSEETVDEMAFGSRREGQQAARWAIRHSSGSVMHPAYQGPVQAERVVLSRLCRWRTRPCAGRFAN